MAKRKWLELIKVWKILLRKRSSESSSVVSITRLLMVYKMLWKVYHVSCSRRLQVILPSSMFHVTGVAPCSPWKTIRFITHHIYRLTLEFPSSLQSFIFVLQPKSTHMQLKRTDVEEGERRQKNSRRMHRPWSVGTVCVGPRPRREGSPPTRCTGSHLTHIQSLHEHPVNKTILSACTCSFRGSIFKAASVSCQLPK